MTTTYAAPLTNTEALGAFVNDRHPDLTRSACRKIARQAINEANPYLAALVIAVRMPASEPPTRLSYSDPTGNIGAARADSSRGGRRQFGF